MALVDGIDAKVEPDTPCGAKIPIAGDEVGVNWHWRVNPAAFGAAGIVADPSQRNTAGRPVACEGWFNGTLFHDEPTASGGAIAWALDTADV